MTTWTLSDRDRLKAAYRSLTQSGIKTRLDARGDHQDTEDRLRIDGKPFVFNGHGGGQKPWDEEGHLARPGVLIRYGIGRLRDDSVRALGEQIAEALAAHGLPYHWSNPQLYGAIELAWAPNRVMPEAAPVAEFTWDLRSSAVRASEAVAAEASTRGLTPAALALGDWDMQRAMA